MGPKSRMTPDITVLRGLGLRLVDMSPCRAPRGLNHPYVRSWHNGSMVGASKAIDHDTPFTLASASLHASCAG